MRGYETMAPMQAEHLTVPALPMPIPMPVDQAQPWTFH